MAVARLPSREIPRFSDVKALDVDQRNYVNRPGGERWVVCSCPCTHCRAADCAFMFTVAEPVIGRLYTCGGCTWERLLRDPKVGAALVAWIRGER